MGVGEASDWLSAAGAKMLFWAGPDAGASGNGNAALCSGEASEMMRGGRTKGTQAARKAGQAVARRQIDFLVRPAA
jgi:hypothetical protein